MERNEHEYSLLMHNYFINQFPNQFQYNVFTDNPYFPSQIPRYNEKTGAPPPVRTLPDKNV